MSESSHSSTSGEESNEGSHNASKVRVTFENVNVDVKKQACRSAMKRLVTSASGYFDSDSPTFILGSSGSGKTTLLNAIADRIPNSRQY